MKRLIVFGLLLLLFTVPAAAQDDVYSAEYDLSGAGELQAALPDTARDFLNEYGIDPADSGWVSALSDSSVFSHIIGLFTGGMKTPLAVGGLLLGLILLTAALPAVSAERGTELTPVSVLCAALCVAAPVWNTVSAAVSAVRGSSSFMLAFVPVFAGVVAVSGGTVSSVSMSALLLAAAEGVGAVAAFAVLPMMGAYLAMSLCTAVSPLAANNDIADLIRRMAFWILSFATTVFLGILGIQTSVNAAADTLALKTGKFILGTAVPIAGPALSEAASTVAASLSLLRSSVGLYGIVALAAILLPILAELLLWRAVLLICGAVAGQFSLGGVTKLIKAVDLMLSLLVGVVLLTAALFIISLTVVVSAVKAA